MTQKLSETRREKLYDDILRKPCLRAWAGQRPEIDEINILQATRLAMRRAAQGAPVSLFYIDAVKNVGLAGEERALIHGDALSYAIAAASVIAKVTRDRLLRAMEEEYPGYGFARHKGYGTAAHMEAIRRLGMCPEHRRSFLKGMGPP